VPRLEQHANLFNLVIGRVEVAIVGGSRTREQAKVARRFLI
jgi:hypothetical protein